MKKTWYFRLLFSYMPVFFLMISFLFAIFFQILNKQAQRDTSRIYASLNSQLIQAVEQPLRLIDHQMVTLQVRGGAPSEFDMLDFFDQSGQPSPYFTYQATRQLSQIKQLNPVIHSLYLVREQDEYVLSLNRVAKLADFPDKPFADSLLKENFSYHWTNVRSFKEFAASREERVVSLARKLVTNRGESGIMVVNVSVTALDHLVSQRIDPASSYARISGTDDAPIAASAGQPRGGAPISTVVSDYTGWTYESGMLNEGGFAIVARLTDAWVAVAAVVVLLGLGSVIYMTNRNYKPLKELIRHIDQMSQQLGERKTGDGNEFHYIESTMHSLVERFQLFKSQSDLNSVYRKKSIFLEVMNGTRVMARKEWAEEMERRGFAGTFRHAAVLVVSIDKYSDIASRFPEHDLALYRFIVYNMFTELVQPSGMSHWIEWINDKEMCAFVSTDKERPSFLVDDVRKVSESAVDWVRRYLPFTITVGIGKPTDAVPKLKDSYKTAMAAVNARVVMGNNRVIGFWETEDGSSMELYQKLEQIRRFLYAFRQLDPDWRAKYNAVFQQFRERMVRRDDIVNLMNYMTFHAFEQIRGVVLNDEMVETNRKIAKDLIDQFESLEDLQEEMLEIFEKFEVALHERLGKGSAENIALQMKQYIEENLSNPDLSLVHLSERFGTPSKNVSALFKEQFDIKFVDFLISKRIELAKELLESTDLSIQDIGQKVGYVNPVSFNRVFKRIVGVPPGDYRKERSG